MTAISHRLLIELATMPVLGLLTFTLPAHPREDEVAGPAKHLERASIVTADVVGATETM